MYDTEGTLLWHFSRLSPHLLPLSDGLRTPPPASDPAPHAVVGIWEEPRLSAVSEAFEALRANCV